MLSSYLVVERDELLVRGSIITALVHARDRALFAFDFACGERAGEAGKLRTESLLLDEESGDVAIDYEAIQRGLDLTLHGRGKKQARDTGLTRPAYAHTNARVRFAGPLYSHL